jgi:hypothetical protein
MQVTGHFYLLNEHFSQEHADAQHGGKESENNLKIEWEDELALKNEISSIEIHRKSVFNIAGAFESGESFSYPVENMIRFDLIGKDDTITQFACSEDVVEEFEIREEEAGQSIHIFMKEEEPFTNPIPGVYIALQDFPKELSK